jgi:phage shock protein B
MEEILIPIIVVPVIFLGLPWIIFHYITKWKSQASLTAEDEKLLDELHDVARRLDERMVTIERIMAAENPSWQQLAFDPTMPVTSELGFEEKQSPRRIGQ